VAARIAFRAPLWWLAGSLSPDPAHALALERLSLDPVLDLGLRGDDGTGALLAVPLLRAAVTPVA
jgi:nicotinate-nucleotide--dimethylbenzimidazole phosphoribosyltransferase